MGKRLLALVIVFATLSGCETYYRVADTETGNLYYTREIQLNRHASGAVTFEDMHTRKKVTLTSFELLEVKKETAVAGVGIEQGNLARD
ncbi:MAG: hypothetical protein ACYSVY_27685 [Planctomycetota bacterium]|jgi:hypothetical protein